MATAQVTMSTATVSKYELALRDFAMNYPEAHEDFPWGHRALKVRGKAFAFLGNASQGQTEMSVSLKLFASHESALLLPFVEPTGYGMGKSGWVTARFPPGEEPPLPLLLSWLDESYRLIAPKRLVALLPPLTEDEEAAPPKRRRATRTAKPAEKAPAKQPAETATAKKAAEKAPAKKTAAKATAKQPAEKATAKNTPGKLIAKKTAAKASAKNTVKKAAAKKTARG
jgi:predicted DNA-binding protein (MmcQ/YjbR family)